LGQSPLLVLVILAIVPWVENDGSVAELKSFELGLNTRVGEGNLSSLVQFDTVDWSVVSAGHLFVVDDSGLGDIDDRLEQSRRSADVVHTGLISDVKRRRDDEPQSTHTRTHR